MRRAFDTRAPIVAELVQLGVTLGGCALLALSLGGGTAGVGAAILCSALLTLGLRATMPRLTMAGALEMALLPLGLIVALPWGVLLLRDLGGGPLAQAFAIAAAAFAALLFGFVFAGKLARNALLTHGEWRRPIRPLSRGETTVRPKVSIHLPCYAEPPAVVIATIDRLAALDYPDFEVLVCDNNTADEALWRPLEAHCAQLNRALGRERFRFFHVAPIAGAKAGALNVCLERMAPDAVLVGVIDADYLSDPRFLARLAGFFEDPEIGYIQTPHDYRGWERDRYLRNCYWEYMPSNKVELPGIAEYGAGYTIGTMCLIRTEALRRAGGWAEWCLTEDSEVSVRLRAVGYEGLYLRDTFGRGLIPDGFEDYKKQRFRWTAGPVQQLLRHWRMYLPGRLGMQSALGGWSKLLELERGLAPLVTSFGTALGILAAVALVALTATGAMPAVDLPDAWWLAMLLGGVAGLVRAWHRYRLSGCRTLRDMAGGEIARLSLYWTRLVGPVAALTGRPLAWRRTPKFGQMTGGLAALEPALPETALGIVGLGLGFAALRVSALTGSDLTLVAGIGLVTLALQFLAAPLMAWLGARRADLPSATRATITSGGAARRPAGGTGPSGAARARG